MRRQNAKGKGADRIGAALLVSVNALHLLRRVRAVIVEPLTTVSTVTTILITGGAVVTAKAIGILRRNF